MKSSCKTILWFRRDLRIEDNPALSAAASDSSVLPVFVWCPQEEGRYLPGRVSRWWLKQSLIHLAQSLKSLGAELVLIKAESTLSALLECINAVGATKVVYNNLYDPISLVRDHSIKQKLGEMGVNIQSYNAELLHEPWEVYDDDGNAFTTFDAYWRKFSEIQKEPIAHIPPLRLVQAAGNVDNCPIEELVLEDESEKSSNALLGRGWSPGWTNADHAFTEFVENHLINYSKDRIRVGGNCTSLLSPYLHFGEISVRKILQSVRMKQIVWKNEQNVAGEESANLFLRAVGLREYSRYLCFNFPYTHEKPLLSNLRYFPWNSDQVHFKAWRQGRTGYPLVDAGMRELWATGWIHNRIRVIVSSFLVKFLRLPWQWGMKYFWDTLLDADLESDILGWQYISSCLPDGHELERLDNPQIQGFNYDPDGEYVRQWLPELVRIPTEWIHHPWDAPLNVLKSAGVDLGSNYPNPIIDIDMARDRLNEAISIMRENEATDKINGTDEVVFDNCYAANSSVQNDVNGNVPSSIASSHDQMVPSMQNSRSGIQIKKRVKPMEDEKPLQGNFGSCSNAGGGSRVDDDLCSTAESCSTKKQATSRSWFSVPQNYPASSKDDRYQNQDSSDLKNICQEEIYLESLPMQNGEPSHLHISRNQIIEE